MKIIHNVAFLMLFSTYCWSQPDTISNLSPAEKIYGISLFWKESSTNFAYFDKAKINWDSAYQTFLPKVLSTKNTMDYYFLLEQFCALLKDGHTNIILPVFSKRSTNVQIGFEYIENKVIVQAILRKDSSLVPIGSELIAVNDIPIMDYFKTEAFPYISASSPQQLYGIAVRFIYPHRFLGDTSKVTLLKLKTPSGNFVSYPAALTYRQPNYLFRSPDSKMISKFLTMLPGNIAYVSLTDFRDTSIVSKFKKILPELYKASGIILDIRYNGGGDSEIGVEILKYFTKQKLIKGCGWKTRDHIAAFYAWGKYFKPEVLKDTIGKSLLERESLNKSYKVGKNDYWYEEGPEIYTNDVTAPKIQAPLVVLTGNNTGSAAEDFLVSLDDIKGRGVTVGERTGGSTGQPLYFELPGGGRARVCTKRDYFPDGREFVGYGIKPDVEIPRTIASFIEDRDIVLEKALLILKKMIDRR